MKGGDTEEATDSHSVFEASPRELFNLIADAKTIETPSLCKSRKCEPADFGENGV